MKHDNPWNLTPQQGATLSALAEVGCGKKVGRELGISYKTVEQHVAQAKLRMGLEHRVSAVVAWDRFCRENKESS